MDETEEQKVIKESEESRSSHSSSSSSKSSVSSKTGSKANIEENKANDISELKDSKPIKKELKFQTNGSSPEQSMLQSPIKRGEEGEEDEDTGGVDFDQSYSPSKSPGHVKQIDKMEIYLQQEEDIVNYCKENEKLWVDESFPSDNRSLFKIPAKVPEWAKDVKTIKWMRPHEISKEAKFLNDKEFKEGDVKQGAFGESAFIGGIVIIATRGEFLEKLFIDFDHFDLGFVTFQFFKNGDWKQVIVDTLLPFDPDSKQICYSQCANPSEFWVPLMEKAYAKLHGCYENIIDNFLMLEGLIDLTGGVAECFTLNEPDTQKMIENNHLWQTMMNYFHQKFYLGCINVVEGKSTKNPDASSRGIFENYYYGILDIREFPKENLKLIRIRNPWGPDGCWNGPFSDDSDEWDKHRNLRDELRLVFKSKKSDGTWWMSFNDWCVHFNKLFICKVFPETWQTYSIESRWQGKTAGGVCPKRMEYEGNEAMPEFLQLDTDDRWFNNPQFRLKVEKETKIYINLMQEDEKLCKSNYIKCNFMIVANHSRRNRIWERPAQSDIIAEAVNKNNIDNPPAREITHQVTLKKFEGKSFGYYMIIPNTMTESRKEEQRPFWLRLFSSDPIEVFEMPTTIEQTIEDSWNEMNAGGRRKIEGKDNPSWCRNPQYFMNLKNPTNLKIILKKTGNIKKFKGVKIGMTICRYLQNLNKFDIKGTGKAETLKKNNKSVAIRGITRLLAQTKGHLEPPEMDFIERKLQILQGEKFRESTYFSDEVGSLYFNWNPTEGPFIIIPSLDHEDKISNYRLTIYSDNPIEIKKLDENKNAVLIGKWEHDLSDGGCHLYEDPFEKDMNMRTWTINPKYLLKFQETENTANLKITLAIAEKNWKSKTKNSVGGMIGIYLLEKRENKLTIENLVNNKEPSFMPLNVICENFSLSSINGKSYYIMPSTFESKISGTFILSVSSDKEFKLEKN